MEIGLETLVEAKEAFEIEASIIDFGNKFGFEF